jgi:hypothetical protein
VAEANFRASSVAFMFDLEFAYLGVRIPWSSHTCAIAFAHTTRAHSNKHLPLHPTAIMRLTAELISNSLSYLNPLKERELDLRGMPYTLTVS